MNYIKKNKKQIIGFIMFIPLILTSIFEIFLSSNINLNDNIISIINVISEYLGIIYLLLPIILVVVYRKELLDDFKKIKTNYKEYLDHMINYYIVGTIGMVIINALLQYGLNLGIAGNEESVRDLLVKAPLYTFISACILAPFQEEMLFRKIMKDFCKNKYVYIIVSGFIFGLLHVLGTASGLEYLYLLPYGFLGSIFALMYVKTNNIWCPIFIHFFHNTLLVLVQMKVNGII